MPPKRKADDDSSEGNSSKGKKTTMSTKTVVTTVVIEEPGKKAKKDGDAITPAKKKAAEKKPQQARKSPQPPDFSGYPMQVPGQSTLSGPYGFPGQPSFSGQTSFPPFPGQSSAASAAAMAKANYPHPLNFNVGGPNFAAPGFPPSGFQSASQSGVPPASSIPQLPLPTRLALPPASSSNAVAKKKPDGGAGGGGKYVWLIYHSSGRSGRKDEQLMGVYTAVKSALQNARVVIDKETGGVGKCQREDAAFTDFSSNIQAENGIIFEVKHKDGEKNVVSFKKVKLNENLAETDNDDQDYDDSVVYHSLAAPPQRAALGWM